MKNPLNWLKGAALAALTALCLALTLTVIDMNTRAAVTFGKLDAEIDEMHRLTLEAGLMTMDARKASAKEISYLDTFNNQFSAIVSVFQQTMVQTRQTLASIQGTSEAATGVMQTTQATVQALQAPIAQATTTLEAAQRTTAALQPVISHLDALVTDPAIPATLANVQSTTAHLDATAKDVQAEVYKYTHPGIWEKIKGVALDIAHVFNPL